MLRVKILKVACKKYKRDFPSRAYSRGRLWLNLWMLYCEEAIMCRSYDLWTCYIQREEREDRDGSRKRKKTKNLEFIMNSSGRVCVHRIFCEWKECSESRKPSIVVYSQWKLEFKVVVADNLTTFTNNSGALFRFYILSFRQWSSHLIWCKENLISRST